AGPGTATIDASPKIRTGATWSCFTNTFTVTPVEALAPTTRPAGRRWPCGASRTWSATAAMRNEFSLQPSLQSSDRMARLDARVERFKSKAVLNNVQYID